MVASAAGVSRLWVETIATLEYRALEGTEGATLPFWKPDSREIGFFAHEKLKTIPLNGGLPVDVWAAPSGMAFEGGATWNSDDVIVFMSPAFRLQRIAAKGGTAPVPVTALENGDTHHRWPSFLPDGQHFLFLAQQGGGAGDLRVGSLDGRSEPSLGRFESNALYASGHLLFLSNGQIVARRFDEDTRKLSGDPFPVGAKSQYLADAGLGAFSASRTGLLAHHPGRLIPDSRLAWIDRGGKPATSISDVSVFLNVAVNPAGTRVAASSFVGRQQTTDIWLFDAERNDGGTRLTTDNASEFDPAWSRDGKEVAFTSNRPARQYSLLRRRANGSGPEELLVTADVITSPEWSPDGRSIFYSAPGGLWIVPLDGERKARIFLNAQSNISGAAISPDGRHIAYSSNKSGRQAEVYVRSFPSGEDEQKVSVAGGRAPRWRSDGKELFFVSLDATLMAADISTVKDLKTAVPRVLFRTSLGGPSQRSYDVAPGGSRFLMPIASESQPTPPISLLLNWPAQIPKQ